MSQPHQEEV